MFKRFGLGLIFAVGLGGSAMAQSGISQKVAVCNPSYPSRCVAVAADGSIPTTGGGGGGGNTTVTATAADPSYVEGSTTNPLSVNLSGHLRTVLGAGSATVGTVNLGTLGGAATAALQSAVQGTFGAVTAERFVPYTPSGTAVDLSTPSAIIGADGTTILSNANPMPISDAGGTITVDGTVTANLGTIAGVATEASLVKLPVAQGSTTSGQSGPLVQGAVTTAPPTYTTAQTSPLSLDPGTGALRVIGATAQNAAPPGGSSPYSLLFGCHYLSAGNIASITLNGQSVCQTDIKGNIRTKVVLYPTAISDNLATLGLAASSDANLAGTTPSVVAASQGYLYDGTNMDAARSIGGSFGSATGVAAVEQAGAPYVRISTNTSTNGIKSGAGILHKVCVNTRGAGSNTATIYDNTTATGTTIAVIDTNTANVACMEYDLAFATGLSVLTATGTPADLTIVYR